MKNPSKGRISLLLTGVALLLFPALGYTAERDVSVDRVFDIPSNRIDTVQDAYASHALDSALASMSGCVTCLTSGLLTVVDRAPARQSIMVYLHEADGWDLLYYGNVSTGKPGRREHFVTPTGVFPLDGSILDYRAEGTYNANHIRGIGVKGMRVWDFGWQETQDWRSPGRVKIRMEMHATDPANLEQRIGRPDSEGCIRIHSDLNKALDQIGALDAGPDRLAQESSAWRQVLGPDHAYSPIAGNTLVVIDSDEAR